MRITTKDNIIEYYLDAIINERVKELTVWEQSFVESIEHQFENCRHLTDKQLERLEQVYDRVTA